MLGKSKKIEKSIRYDEEKDVYFVQFSFRDVSALRAFPTLEDARAYRDAVNAEKLRIKTEETVAEIRKLDKHDILFSNDIYPYNALKGVGLNPEDVVPAFIQDFDNILCNIVSQREEFCIVKFYKELKTLADIGKCFNVTRERVRQIIAKGLKKVRFHAIRYEHVLEKIEERKRYEEEYEALQEKREKLIKAFRETGIISDEMAVYFGDINIGLKEGATPPFAKMSIDELDLSVRSYNCLRRAGINTLQDLMNLYEEELYKVKNLGKKSLREIKGKMAEMGLYFKGEKLYDKNVLL